MINSLINKTWTTWGCSGKDRLKGDDKYTKDHAEEEVNLFCMSSVDRSNELQVLQGRINLVWGKSFPLEKVTKHRNKLPRETVDSLCWEGFMKESENSCQGAALGQTGASNWVQRGLCYHSASAASCPLRSPPAHCHSETESSSQADPLHLVWKLHLKG